MEECLVIGLIIPFRPQLVNSIVKVTVPGNTASPVFQIGNGAPVAVSTLQRGWFLHLFLCCHGGRVRRSYGWQG